MAPRALKGLSDGLRGSPRPGEAGESMACSYLVDSGFVILARNYRCRAGEVDIVARDGESTVFVEVKERMTESHGEGHEAVTPTKRRRIVRAARLYAAANGLSETPLRFDVVSITLCGPTGEREIRHDRDAFDSDGS